MFFFKVFQFGMFLDSVDDNSEFVGDMNPLSTKICLTFDLVSCLVYLDRIQVVNGSPFQSIARGEKDFLMLK